MRIKKVENYVGTVARVLNDTSESNKDVYSADFINKTINKSIDDLIDNLSNKIYIYYIKNIETQLAAGDWRDICLETTTETLPKGKYLVMAYSHLTTTLAEMGIATQRIMVDDSELAYSRASIPIGYSLITNPVSTTVITLNDAKTCTINLQVYANKQFTVSYDSLVIFIKLD